MHELIILARSAEAPVARNKLLTCPVVDYGVRNLEWVGPGVLFGFRSSSLLINCDLERSLKATLVNIKVAGDDAVDVLLAYVGVARYHALHPVVGVGVAVLLKIAQIVCT